MARQPDGRATTEGIMDEAQQNRILSRLQPDELNRILPRMRRVEIFLGDVIFRDEDVLTHVYFPTTCVISLLTNLADGSGVEVGLVGNEGFASLSALIGAGENKVGTIQHTGAAMIMDATTFRAEVRQRGTLFEMSMRYAYALSSQISQSVVCNVRHSIEQRLIRWLLMHHDRVRTDEFTLTQEFIAAMLGVRRAGISEAAKNLQNAGFIDYRRGHILIKDRVGLESACCECYAAVKNDFELIYDVSKAAHINASQTQ